MKYEVRDGEVCSGDYVWWHCEEGPVKIKVLEHDLNISSYPEFHSIKEPVFVKHPTVDWLVVYEYQEMYKHITEGRKVVKTKHERKRPEFTFEDGYYFDFYLERSGEYAEYSGLDNLTVFCQISGDSYGTLTKARARYIIKIVGEALVKSREICSTYAHKELRKKLKLYIKWLQSEMSKLESSKQGE